MDISIYGYSMRIAPCSYSCQSVKISSGQSSYSPDIGLEVYTNYHTASFLAEKFFRKYFRPFSQSWCLTFTQIQVWKKRYFLGKKLVFSIFLMLPDFYTNAIISQLLPFFRWEKVGKTSRLQLIAFSLSFSFPGKKERKKSFNQTACLVLFVVACNLIAKCA